MTIRSFRHKKRKVVAQNEKNISINKEEVYNVCSVKGLYLIMNRSILSEEIFGILKQYREYK